MSVEESPAEKVTKPLSTSVGPPALGARLPTTVWKGGEREQAPGERHDPAGGQRRAGGQRYPDSCRRRSASVGAGAGVSFPSRFSSRLDVDPEISSVRPDVASLPYFSGTIQ